MGAIALRMYFKNKMKSDCILAIAIPSPPEIKWTSGEVQANATTGETRWIKSAADEPFNVCQ